MAGQPGFRRLRLLTGTGEKICIRWQRYFDCGKGEVCRQHADIVANTKSDGRQGGQSAFGINRLEADRN